MAAGMLPIFTSYHNAHERLPYICLVHSDRIRYIRLNDVQQGKGCQACGSERAGKTKRKSIEEVLQCFIDRNYTPLFNNYTNNKQKLKYICNVHQEAGPQEIVLNSLLSGRGCFHCGNEKKSGPNAYNWKNGVSCVNAVLRSEIRTWQAESYAVHRYCCDISKSKRDLVIHHLRRSFHDIRDEALIDLGFELKRSNFKTHFTAQDYDKLRCKFIKLHYEYGLGIPLSRELHALFHRMYGNRNNTPEQYFEFKSDFQKGWVVFK